MVNKKHYLLAKAVLEDVERSLPIVMSLITSTTHGAILAKVYSTIRRAGSDGINKTTLLGMFLHQLTSRELEEIILTLKQSKKIGERITGASDVVYVARG